VTRTSSSVFPHNANSRRILFHEHDGRARSRDAALGAVTHRTHEGALVACDYICSCNPSACRAAPRRWDELVLAELWAHMAAESCASADEAATIVGGDPMLTSHIRRK
jgi:hypothetical protein